MSKRRLRASNVQFESEMPYASGGTRFIHANYTPDKKSDGSVAGFFALVTDVTKSKRAERALRIAAQQQRAVALIGEFSLGHSLQEIFDFATATIAQTLEVEYCKVLELLPGGAHVLLRSGVGWKPGLVGSATVDTGMNSQAGYTLASSAPVIVADMRQETRFNGPPLLVEHGVISGMSCVIRRPDGQAWGVLGTHARRRIDFTQDDISFLTAVAHVLGSAVEHERAERARRESDARYGQLLALTPAAVYSCDSIGLITYFNQRAAQLWGRAPKVGDTDERFCGSEQMMLPDGAPLPHDKCPMAVALREGKSFRDQEVNIRRPDGSIVTALVNIDPIRDEQGEVIGAINAFHDVSEIKKAEQALRESESLLESELADTKLLQRISAAMIQNDDVEAIYEQIMDAAVAIMRSQYASMQMLYPERGEGGELRLLACHGFSREAAKQWEWVSTKSSCTCGVALKIGKRFIAADVANCEVMAGTADQTNLLKAGILAAQSTPLVSRGGQIIGMITTHWSQPHEPSERDLRLMDILARQAADLIERKSAEMALRASEERQRILSEALAQLLASHDPHGVVREVFPRVAKHLDVDTYFNFLVNEDGEALYLHACAGVSEQVARDIRRLEFGQAICGTVAQTRRAIVATDIQRSDYDKANLVRGMGIQVYACNPLMIGDRLIGTLSFASRTRTNFSEAELEFMRQIAQYVAVAMDRAQTTAAVRESGERFRMVADNISTLAWTCNELGNVTWYNKRWLDYTGLSFEEMKDWGWKKVHHPDHVDRVVASVTRSRETGEVWEDTFPLRGKDGQYRWFLSRAYPIRDERGNIIRWFGTNTDITGQRQAEEALRQHKATLEEAVKKRTEEALLAQQRMATSQRMAAVGTLASGLAHDMTNLLLPLGTRLESLLTQQSVGPVVHNELVIISALLDHLRELSRNLSLFSRDPDHEGIAGRTHIAQWASSVHKLLDASVGREIVVKWDCPEGLPEAAIAPHRLTQAVQNLIHNARDAVLAAKAKDPRRTELPRITVQARPAPDNIRDAWGVAISVIDNGIGMDEETRRRAIEPFFTTRNRPHEPGPPGLSGSGLGLSLAHQIVERAGGSMEIESELGKGTTITLTIPIASSRNA